MNENVDLTQILKDCPKGTKFYSSLHGELLYSCMYLSSSASKITFIKPDSVSMVDGSTPITVDYYRDGRYFPNQGECAIFPSKEQRDWSKFERFWDKPKIDRFDPKTLKPFDKVLVKTGCSKWTVSLFSFVEGEYVAVTNNARFSKCIPFNEDTKYLLGTGENAPQYYRYWED